MIANARITRYTPGTATGLVHVLRYRPDPSKFRHLADVLSKVVCSLELAGHFENADKIQITVSKGKTATPAKRNGGARGSHARVAADRTAVRGGKEDPRGDGSTPSAGPRAAGPNKAVSGGGVADVH